MGFTFELKLHNTLNFYYVMPSIIHYIIEIHYGALLHACAYYHNYYVGLIKIRD